MAKTRRRYLVVCWQEIRYNAELFLYHGYMTFWRVLCAKGFSRTARFSWNSELTYPSHLSLGNGRHVVLWAFYYQKGEPVNFCQ